MTIKRPDVVFNEKNHTYTLDGHKLDGVSSVAKVGDDNVWSIAAAWAFRIGYEGAYDVLQVPNWWETDDLSKDDLREELKKRGLTPFTQVPQKVRYGSLSKGAGSR